MSDPHAIKSNPKPGILSNNGLLMSLKTTKCTIVLKIQVHFMNTFSITTHNMTKIKFITMIRAYYSNTILSKFGKTLLSKYARNSEFRRNSIE